MEWEKMVERLTALLNAGKHSELRGALMMLNEVDIAHFMESLDKEKLLLCFDVLSGDDFQDLGLSLGFHSYLTFFIHSLLKFYLLSFALIISKKDVSFNLISFIFCLPVSI